jgi:GNAT superfamily N-acetyltransferase
MSFVKGFMGEFSMHVRDYRATDGASCLVVFESNVPKFFAPSERRDFEVFLNALPGLYLATEDEAGAIRGCGGYAVSLGTATADLCWGMVHREHHGTGLGRFLLNERLARIRADLSIKAVALNTSQHTTGFYERIGFVIQHIERDGYAPGVDLCEMRLVLPSREQYLPAVCSGKGTGGATPNSR